MFPSVETFFRTIRQTLHFEFRRPVHSVQLRGRHAPSAEAPTGEMGYCAFF